MLCVGRWLLSVGRCCCGGACCPVFDVCRLLFVDCYVFYIVLCVVLCVLNGKCCLLLFLFLRFFWAVFCRSVFVVCRLLFGGCC